MKIKLASALLLCGCVAPPAPTGAERALVVRTVPEGATITFGDGTTCRTPCRVTVDGPLDLTIGRAGYEAVRTAVDRETAGPLVIEMQPVARTEPVEATELPEL